ncbi:MAG: hypothetical protein IRZ00_11290 [Gemmatimonadetes bacterium]|nr:hypothetical protein [Gemmatimonadota bacterium]
MFDRCLFCHRQLPRNEELGHLPHGRRVAFDPVRGRLWAVCPACRRWNLAPIEERWEALEELEKLTTDRAKLLSQTDNIALLRVGELEVVRVGRANLTEEAWWRYGLEMVRRRRAYQMMSVAGGAIVAGVLVGGAAAGVTVFGGWWIFGRAARQFPNLTRALKFGRTAWRGRATCVRCGRELNEISFRERGALVPMTTGEDEVAVGFRCVACGAGVADPGALRPASTSPLQAAARPGFILHGAEAEHVLRRVLAYHNYRGGRETQVREATRLIEEAGSAAALSRLVSRAGRLSALGSTEAIAFEIAVNEERERQLLELELAELEARWREEEELAAIVDGELTWVPGPRPA